MVLNKYGGGYCMRDVCLVWSADNTHTHELRGLSAFHLTNVLLHSTMQQQT